jgi:hypothetical protein
MSKSSALFGAICLAFTSIAVANPVTVKVASFNRSGVWVAQKIEHKYDHKQYAGSSVRISDSGLVEVETQFSNGKQIDGDHFAVHVFFLGPDRELLGAVRQVKGLNGSMGARATEGTEKTRIAIRGLSFGRLNKGTVVWKFSFIDGVDDRACWSSAANAASKAVLGFSTPISVQTALEALRGTESGGTQPGGWGLMVLDSDLDKIADAANVMRRCGW